MYLEKRISDFYFICVIREVDFVKNLGRFVLYGFYFNLMGRIFFGFIFKIKYTLFILFYLLFNGI